jgi:hypothetical protein
MSNQQKKIKIFNLSAVFCSEKLWREKIMKIGIPYTVYEHKKELATT